MTVKPRNPTFVIKFKSFFWWILPLILFGCKQDNPLEREIAAIPMQLEVVRFDQVFAQASVSDIPELKKTYPQFFPAQFPDSIWEQRLQDTLQLALNRAVEDKFPSSAQLESDLTRLFQHLKYYQPGFTPPQIFTVISDVDYKQKIILTGQELVIGLDTYLGADHEFYEGLPRYVAQNLKASQLGPDVAHAYGQSMVARPRQRNLLSQMIYYGKLLYLKQLWLPWISDAEKIGYTDAQWQWVEENEVDMWRYFIENELLYSTDPKLLPRFISPAPFSKFYLEIDNESPGRVGQYLGWQIVRAFMENNDITPQQLLDIGYEDVFNQSRYKPKK